MSEAAEGDGCTRLYGPSFWAAYAANMLVCITLALLYRYADFVTFLGGDEFHLGWIVGIGMVGSVLMRLSLGTGIDRYGPRVIWLGSLVILSATCFGHLAITSHEGAAIYLLRVVFCTAIAGVFSASTTFVSARAPTARMAELIGMLGTSGFAGMMFGTILGDVICGEESIGRTQVDRLFLACGFVTVAALPFAWLSTRRACSPSPGRCPSVLRLLRRYSPGMVLVVAVVVGAALTLPATFLRPYAAELNIPRIGVFFTVCAPVALAVRLGMRRLPERIGLPRMILAGIALMIVSQFLFLLVHTEWQLAIPGVAFGGAQAILYPMVVAAVCVAFPVCYRGLGTTLSLAALDLGQVIGSPVCGAIIHYSQSLGLASFPTMFVSMALVLVLTAMAYAWAVFPNDGSRGAADACSTPMTGVFD